MARTCQTCKHYEPSTVWRRGWCRNPRLYTPQQSHLVDQDSLDCARGFGNSWEPIAGEEQMETSDGRSPLRMFAPVAAPQLATAGATLASSAGGYGTGGGGSTGGGFGDEPPPRSGRDRAPGGERAVSYQPEERYWTDYLRIALPVIGLLLMLGLFWYWATALIDGDESDTEPPTQIAAQATIINATATVGATAPAAAITAVPGAQTAVAPTNPPPSAAPATSGQQTQQQQQPAAPTPTTAPSTAGGNPQPEVAFAPGTVVFIREDVNLRSGPSSISADVVQLLPAQTRLTITGQWQPGDDNNVWWPVTLVDNPSVSGYLADQFVFEE